MQVKLWLKKATTAQKATILHTFTLNPKLNASMLLWYLEPWGKYRSPEKPVPVPKAQEKSAPPKPELGPSTKGLGLRVKELRFGA